MNYDLILKFILDQTSKNQTKAGVDELTKAFDDMDDAARTRLAVAMDQMAAHLDELEAKFHATRRSIEQMSRAGEKIRSLSAPLFATGAAIVGGLYAAANKEANRIKDAGGIIDETTERWLAANDRIQKSTQRIGHAAETDLLPVLEKAASVAEKIAAMVAKNPEAVLRAGAIIGGIGTIGLAVSKGIQLKASLDYLAANAEFVVGTKTFQSSVREFLAGAALQKGGGAVPTAAGGTIAGLASTAGMVVTGLIASGAAVTLLDQLLQKWGYGQARKDAIEGARDKRARIYPGALPPNERNLQAELNRAQERGDEKEIKRLRNELKDLGTQAEQTADNIDKAIGQLSKSENASKVVDAFQKWKEDDARIVEDAAKQRTKIMADAAKAESDADTKYAKEVASINTSANKQATSLIAGFRKQDKQDEANYQTERANILKDGGKEIRAIEQDHQERLRKLIQDHDERAEELTAARDALGWVKEQRRFNQEQDDLNRSTRAEVAQRRVDLAERLQELDQQHKIEQAQRLAQFKEELAANEAQRKEELAQAATAHQEEMSQIQSQRAQQLRELQEGLNAERLRRREAFIGEVRDLDAALLGEQALRKQRYAAMYADLEKFLSDYQKGIAKLPAVAAPTHDFTGYAYSGMYRMAANGQPEWVLSGTATRAAEAMISGQLTQDAVLSAIARGTRHDSRSLTINDHSRFDGRISNAERQQIKREARNEIMREFGLE